MAATDRRGSGIYKVVINHEEQYAVWPASRPSGRGWRDEGKTGTERACLAYVKKKLSGRPRPRALQKPASR